MSKPVQKDDEIHQNTLEIFKKCSFFFLTTKLFLGPLRRASGQKLLTIKKSL